MIPIRIKQESRFIINMMSVVHWPWVFCVLLCGQSRVHSLVPISWLLYLSFAFQGLWLSTAFLILKLWILMFWIPPSLVILLDHEIPNNYWTDKISFRATPWCVSLVLHNPGLCLASLFPKQNMTLWPCRPQAKRLPSEPLPTPQYPRPSLSVDCMLLVGPW